jgi:predicted membrane channel-forming protein YqfA (hemolysin III family)
MRIFLRYLELTLTAAGVVVVIVVYALCRHMNPWKAAALCAVVVGVLHGLIFYAVRSAQREARNRNVFSIRGMLEDMMKNRLQVVLYPASGEEEDWRSAAQRAVWEIQARLNFIEAESLKTKAKE